MDMYILVFTLIAAVLFDLKYRRIPNKLTFTASLLGLLYSFVNNGLYGIVFSLGGFIVGLAIFLIPFSMGGMGAGDVKLMAAIGSFMGWKLTVYSALLTAIAGGIIVIGYTIYKGYFIGMIKNIGISAYKQILYFAYLATQNEKIITKYKEIDHNNSIYEKKYIPYGVAIAIGTLIVLIGNYLGYPPFV